MLKINLYSSSQKDTAVKWNDYVQAHPKSCCYHLIEWKQIIEESFNLQSFYIYASDPNGNIKGILPLFLSKSILFGTYLTSIPFFNYGGILAEDNETVKALFNESANIARETKAKHVELRHIDRLILGIPTKTHKVRMIMNLQEDSSKVWDGFKSKLRSQIKRAMREEMTVKVGSMELVDCFYKVFSQNMRDLGTPVWSKKIFSKIIEVLPSQSKISVVYFNKHPVASGFLIGFKDSLEIWTASSIKEYNSYSPNMLLYWSVISYACENGYKLFDFGRSSPDTGTFRFKEQWGSYPEPLHWQYWLKQGSDLPEINPNNPKYKAMINIWKKMPCAIANTIGPKISRNLP